MIHNISDTTDAVESDFLMMVSVWVERAVAGEAFY